VTPDSAGSDIRRGLVLGCGGPIGFAWSAIALDELERALGWDVRDATVIQGTSAGAEMAALLGAGLSVAEIVNELDVVAAGSTSTATSTSTGQTPLARRLRNDPPPLPPLPWPSLPQRRLAWSAVRRRVDALAGLAGLLPRGRGNPRFLTDLGEGLFPDGAWPSTEIRLMAADRATGELIALDATQPDLTVGQAISASWAIPGWFPPVKIGERKLVDGGTVSPTAAHLLSEHSLDEVYIVAPMSTRGGAPARGLDHAERLLRRPMTKRVDHEQRFLEGQGIKVIRIEPGVEELKAMGPNFMDTRARAATMIAAREQLPNRVRTQLESQL
jgi:NTE family protein